jgi:hypothetical protein
MPWQMQLTSDLQMLLDPLNASTRATTASAFLSSSFLSHLIISMIPPDSRIAFIAPRLPPSICGIGDYTYHLLTNLPCSNDILLLVRDGLNATKRLYPGSSIELLPFSRKDFIDLLNINKVSILIVQYSGYGYDPRGAPLSLLKSIRRWRSESKSRKLIIMAHELWNTPSFWKPDYFRQILHKRELCSLAACADQVFTSTTGYAESLSYRVKKTNLKTLPIGSNIIPIQDPRLSERKLGSWVLFGKQGSRIVSLKALGPKLADLNRHGCLMNLIVVGSSDGQQLEQEECTLLRSFLPINSYVRTGLLSNERISEILLNAEHGILAQTPESYTKSTILMAYSAHGVLPVVAYRSPLTFSWMRSVDDLLAINSDNLQLGSLRDEMLSWYQLTGSWSTIANAYITSINCESLTSCS